MELELLNGNGTPGEGAGVGSCGVGRGSREDGAACPRGVLQRGRLSSWVWSKDSSRPAGASGGTLWHQVVEVWAPLSSLLVLRATERAVLSPERPPGTAVPCIRANACPQSAAKG